MENYPHKILIVEDEQAMLTTLVDNLSAIGFKNILQASNGGDGLEMALKENPDLVILDIILPKIDGMTVLKKLREDPAGKMMKVIMLTNLNADDNIMHGVIEDEPSYYIVKSDHSIDDILEKVKMTLGLETVMPK
jgi:DNA-binding response OmpR family regulator